MDVAFAIPETLPPPANPVQGRSGLFPLSPRELRASTHAGENDSDAVERLLARVARTTSALDLAIGDGLVALSKGDRLISLGFSNLGDYGREVLGIAERTVEAATQLSRGLRSRPLLRAAVMAGEVRPRNALTVLPVAKGDGEAAWVERARNETVRALEKAVRALRGRGEEQEEWTRFRVRLTAEQRATVDEALELAGRATPGSRRPQRLEALAQEYAGWHPVEAGDDRPRTRCALQLPGPSQRREAQREQLERETERWSYLDPVDGVAAPEIAFDELSAAELDARLRALAAERADSDHVFGYCAYSVLRSGLWQTAGFADFDQYCEERLGLCAKTVRQRARLERRLWQVPALWAARDAGLSYEKVRALSRLPDREVEAWLPRAEAMTCIALRDAIADRHEGKMRAAGLLGARLPEGTVLLLESAFRAARAVEGCFLDDGRCLVRVAEHFIATWKHLKRRRKRAQRLMEEGHGRCCVPGCSRRAVHRHHIIPRSQGGPDDDWNLVPLCAFHHLRGVHGGYLRVRGRYPDALVWELTTQARLQPSGDGWSASAVELARMMR